MNVVSSTPPASTRVLRATDDYVVAVHRNVMLQYVVGAIDGDFLRASLEGHDAAIRVDPSGYGVITLVSTSAKIPPSFVRDQATELRKKTQHLLRAQSVCIGGEGFFASTMRAVITGIVTVARSRVPLCMARDEAEAARFVTDKLGLGDPGELEGVLRGFTARGPLSLGPRIAR